MVSGNISELLLGKPRFKRLLIMICLKPTSSYLALRSNAFSVLSFPFHLLWWSLSWLPTAVLLAAPSPGDVGEPLHVRTHHQQEDGAGHHRGQRYACVCAAFDRDIGVTRVTAKSDANGPHKLEAPRPRPPSVPLAHWSADSGMMCPHMNMKRAQFAQ